MARRFIKTGFGFLTIGLLTGVGLLLPREVLGVWPSPYLVSAHTHLVLVGFVMFMILGVALWLFPRPRPDDRRYRPGRIAAVYWCLTVGTGLRFAGEVLHTVTAGGWLAAIVVAGGAAQAFGLLMFGWTMWSRIRPIGSHIREARGERF